MKSTISTLEAFNDVRNNQSLAHDNRTLERHEAFFLCNHVVSVVRPLDATVTVSLPATAHPVSEIGVSVAPANKR